MLLTQSFVSRSAEVIDEVAVIVDQGVILESEITGLIDQVKKNAAQQNQALPSDRALRTQAIERLIGDNLLAQLAQRMGIQITDSQLEQTIDNMARQQGGNLAMLQSELQSAGLDYSEYRESVRKEMIAGEVTRAYVRRRVYITPQEIDALVQMISEQGNEQAEYQLGHILIGFPSEPSEQDITDARVRAEKVLNLLQGGSDFAKIAIASSSGANALDGGNMGWLNINSMPTLFAEVVQGQEKDALIGPIRSGAGFHILKILDTRGVEQVKIEEVNARHILIKPSIILSDDKAKQQLLDFRAQIIAGDADFAELAKAHSADPGSALKGGELGFADPSVYVPEFKTALQSMAVGEISQPIRSVHGWHLIEVIAKRVDDVTEDRKKNKAYQLLFNRKFAEEKEAWLREIRDKAYVEVLGDE